MCFPLLYVISQQQKCNKQNGCKTCFGAKKLLTKTHVFDKIIAYHKECARGKPVDHTATCFLKQGAKP
jgi:hypothetical protein